MEKKADKPAETPKDTVYVVSCTEIDRDCTLCADPYSLRVVGLYHHLSDASAEANKHLIEMKRKLEKYYDRRLESVQKEINNTVQELAYETDPATTENLKYIIAKLEEAQRRYQEKKIPEMFVDNGPDGELCEITARDEAIGWLCAYDIEKMPVK
jgi:hypothetical protein